MDNTKLRPWQGLIGLAVVLLASVFVFAYVQYALGGVGLVLTELFIALVAVAGVFAFRGTWRDLLPLAKPKARYVVGSVVLWLGVFFLVIALANIQLKLFPETANTSQALSDFFSKESFLMAVIITPLLAGV
jgi:magnesium-transporting ATPase (P-type)